MKCITCGEKIDTSDPSSYEEVGSIEFAHVACRDRVKGIEEEEVTESQELQLDNQ